VAAAATTVRGRAGHRREPGLTIEQAAAGRATMTAVLVSLGIGALLLVPSMALLFVIFQRGHAQETRTGDADGR
jgi:cytochrome bd-type quinol oxidase subunit 2